MSHGKENPATVKARNARPKRAALRSNQGTMWYKDHPEIHKERNKYKPGAYTLMLDEARNPLTIKSENVAITSDWHAPFYDNDLVNQLFADATEHGTTDLIIAGDMWDCDNYSKFTSMAESGMGVSQTFKGETEEVKKLMRRILMVFTNVYICRGNHCKRWIDLNAGKMGMKELFALARPSNMSEDAWDKRVHITTDDHINLIQDNETWLCCHPRNFRITPLSVARDLSAKHLCNVIVAHGHAFNQGRDRSGQFRVADGGGLFERAALDYTRETTCHPMTRSGFYILKNGTLYPYEGKA
jgi:hypothetical protein